MKITTFAYDPNAPIAYADRIIKVDEKTGDVTGDTHIFRINLLLCRAEFIKPGHWRLPASEVGKFISLCTKSKRMGEGK